GLLGDSDAVRCRFEPMHRVGDEILDDSLQRDRVCDDRWIARAVGAELDVLVPLRGPYDLRDERIQIALTPLRWWRQSLVARGQRLEIRDAGIDRLPALGEYPRQGAWLVTF